MPDAIINWIAQILTQQFRCFVLNICFLLWEDVLNQMAEVFRRLSDRISSCRLNSKLKGAVLLKK